jgi:hypothetical protein
MLDLSQDVPLPEAKDQETAWIILGAMLLACVLWAFLYPYSSEAWKDLKIELKKVKR